MRVKFTENYNYDATPAVTTAYKAGWEGTVKRDCAEKAIAAGKAVAAGQVRRKPDDGTEIGG